MPLPSSNAPLTHHAVVSGASGFIGRHLCRTLQERGIRVTAVHRHSHDGPWNQELLIDLGSDDEILLPPGVDSVFHLAGFAHAEPGFSSEALHQAITVRGTKRLLDACRPTVRRFVYFSSVKAMGESTPKSCLDELSVPAPSTSYGRARLMAERCILQQSHRMHTSILRLPLVYGPGVKGNLERMLKAIKNRRLPVLPEFSNHRSMVHVDDVVSAAIAATEHPSAAGRVYLLCDGHHYSTRDIQLCMYRAAGVKPPVLAIPRIALRGAAYLGDVLRSIGVRGVPLHSDLLAKLTESACYQASRAHQELDWQPQHSLADAVPAMLAALRT